MKTGFLEGPDGNKSNSRLIADFIVGSAKLMCWVFLIVGLFRPELVKYFLQIATAIGVIWASVAGTSLIFLFGQKFTETKINPIVPPDDNAK